MPISTTSTPGTSCGCTRSGGKPVPPLESGVRAIRQVEVGKRFGCHQHFSRRRDGRLQTCRQSPGALPTSAGSRDGSMPNNPMIGPPI